MKTDIIIVGQGLAGSVLALTLIRKGLKVLVVDKGNTESSSAVAAGIYNPVAYKRMLPSWNSIELLSYLDDFAGYAQNVLGHQILFPVNSCKIFSSEQDRDLFLKREPQNRMPEFTDGILRNDLPNVRAPYGFIKFHRTGFLYVEQFIRLVRNYLKSIGALVENKFEVKRLTMEAGVRYEGRIADRIVFCTGTGSNGYWDYLPFKPVKGELMLIAPKQELPPYILVKDGFLMPVEDGRFVAGSTFEWSDLSTDVTEKGLNALKEKIAKITDVDYTILDRKAGIRPASHDRRPYVGWHKSDGRIGILNGLGSKGVLNAPYCAEMLAESIVSGSQIPAEINVSRIRA